MRLAFFGTPDFSVPALDRLHQAGHEIAAVYSQPPRPAQRGQKDRPSQVARRAMELDLPLFTPASLKGPERAQAFVDLAVDAGVVVAYGLLLPQAFLSAPRFGCLNIHASLLPRWRGAAPIHRAILAGDSHSGITIMQMTQGLDEGPILAQTQVPITQQTTAQMLHDQLAIVGADLMVRTLARLPLPATPQPSGGVTFAHKLQRAEGRIDWTKPAEELERQVRAFTPWPGSFFMAGEEQIKVLGAEVVPGKAGAAVGQVIAPATIACAKGALKLTRLQRPGKAPLAADAFLRGFSLEIGSKLS